MRSRGDVDSKSVSEEELPSDPATEGDNEEESEEELISATRFFGSNAV